MPEFHLDRHNRLDEWNKVGSNFPYHYLGSAKTLLRIGEAFEKAVLALRGSTR
jgi:hypothetical protein